MDLSLLSLFPATREQILESRRRTFPQWGKGSSLEEYLQRDAATEQSECGRDGKFITWVLAPRSDPQTTDFLCACETFCRRGLARTTSGVEDTACYGIASVFTPPHLRHKGYARHMMRLLHWILAPESSLPSSEFPVGFGVPPERKLAGDASFSALYSDVGEEFYDLSGPAADQRGWIVDKPVSTEWHISECSGGIQDSQATMQQLIWLKDGDLKEAWNADAQKIKEELSTRSVDKTVYTFLPNDGVAEFQYQRSKGIWSKLKPLPIYWGVCSVASDPSSTVNIAGEITNNSQVLYATWAFDFSAGAPQGLIITRLRATREHFPQLLGQIIQYAKSYEFPKVEIWNLDAELREVAQRTGGHTFSRKEHLPAVKWYGEGDAEWILNEKFCWC